MEALFTQALQKGAQDLARLLRLSEPNSAFVTGTGRTRGFVLDGYGLFFDVDVPNMKYSVLWSAQMVQLAQEREKWMQTLASGRLDDQARKIAESQLRQTERLMMAAQGGAVLIPNPQMNTQMAPQDRVTATVADTNLPPATLVQSAPGQPVAQLPPVMPPPDVRDPNELYTESVKNALIDAMLKYSAFLKIGDSEWLTVAASDSVGSAGQFDEASRIVIRIKGIDLTAFQSGKLTREEVLKKVEVREF